MDLNEIGEAGGFKNLSQASAATNFSPNLLKLLKYDSVMGCVFKLVIWMGLIGGACFLIGLAFHDSNNVLAFILYILCGLSWLITIAGAGLMGYAGRMMAINYKNGLLTAGVIERTGPISVIHIANISTGGDDDYRYGVKRVIYDSFPKRELEPGRRLPVVSTFYSFDDLFSSTWKDYTTTPVVFGCSDAQKLSRCLQVVESDEDGKGSYFEILDRFLKKNQLPEGDTKLCICDIDGNQTEVRMVEGKEEEKKGPPPLPPQNQHQPPARNPYLRQ